MTKFIWPTVMANCVYEDRWVPAYRHYVVTPPHPDPKPTARPRAPSTAVCPGAA